jgi:hypothetical protein
MIALLRFCARYSSQDNSVGMTVAGAPALALNADDRQVATISAHGSLAADRTDAGTKRRRMTEQFSQPFCAIAVDAIQRSQSFEINELPADQPGRRPGRRAARRQHLRRLPLPNGSWPRIRRPSGRRLDNPGLGRRGPERPELSASPGRVAPGNTAWNASRKPLAAEFTYNEHTLFVIVNHFKSKNGDQGLFGPQQPPVLSSEVQRNQQATLLAAFVGDILAADPTANVAVVGDLNDFQFSPPVQKLKDAGLTAMIETLPPNERYSYVFEGNSQVLDHIMRAKVEHPFLIIKRIFRFVKTRYKGLVKNAHRLFVTCALTNLYLMRRRLWRLSRA